MASRRSFRNARDLPLPDCDAYGNGGFEGGPALWNVWQLIRAAGGSGNSGGAWGHYSKYGGSIVGDASGNYYQNKDIVGSVER